MVKKGLIKIFKRDGIEEWIEMKEFKERIDKLKFGDVENDRKEGDIRIGGNKVKKIENGILGIDKELINVDIDDMGEVGKMIERKIERRREIEGIEEIEEEGREGEIGEIEDIEERNIIGESKGIKEGKENKRRKFWGIEWIIFREGLRDGENMVRSREEEEEKKIEKKVERKEIDMRGNGLRSLIIMEELVRKEGIGIGEDKGVGNERKLIKMRKNGIGEEGEIK